MELPQRLRERDPIAGRDQSSATFEQRDAPAAVEMGPIGHARRATRREQVTGQDLSDLPITSPQLGEVEVTDSERGELWSELDLQLSAERDVFEIEKRTWGFDLSEDEHVLLPPPEGDGAAGHRTELAAAEDCLEIGQRLRVGAERLERLADGGERLDASVGGAELVLGIVEAMIPPTAVTRLEAHGIEMEPEAPDP